MGCGCNKGGANAYAYQPGTIYRHHRPDGSHEDYRNKSQADHWAASQGGHVETITNQA